MKILISVLGILVIAGGVWWYMSKDAAPMYSDDDAHEEVMADDDMAAGTQLAGTETATHDANGNLLMGGDAVVSVGLPGQASFTVLGSNYEYDIDKIKVKEGDIVTIYFRSVDGFHDWVIDEFDAATEKVQTDGETSVTFVADKKGSFEYYCSVGQHRENGMVGTLIVE